MIDLVLSGRNLFILFILLSGTYLQPLLPCNTTRFMKDSKLIRHMLGFFTLLFFVVVSDTEFDKHMALGTILVTSVIIYAWFILSSKMTANWWFILSILLGALYLINLYEDRQTHEDPDTKRFLSSTKEWILGGSLALTIVGFFIYLGEKKLDYRGKFNYSDFFLGTTECKGTPTNIPYLTSLQAAFFEAPGSRGGQKGGGGGGGGVDDLEMMARTMSGGGGGGGGGGVSSSTFDPFTPPPPSQLV